MEDVGYLRYYTSMSLERLRITNRNLRTANLLDDI
jgi:hypothetical protein